MSTERDAPTGASEPTATPELISPGLKPPPRVVPPITHRVTRSARGRSAATRSTATLLTVAFFGVLGLALIAVFVVLPDLIRDRQEAQRDRLADVVASTPLPGDTPQAVEPSIETADPEAMLDEPAPEIVPTAPPETPSPAPKAPAETPPASPPQQRTTPPPSPHNGTADRKAGDNDAPRREAKEAFQSSMSEGLAALDREDYAGAREAFARAAKLRPGSPQSADGLARAEAGARLGTISALRAQASAAEAAEDWHAARQRYEAALEIDPTIEFALDGRARSSRRAELSDRVEFHLTNPGRLSSDEVLQEASIVLEQVSEIETPGPKLQQQREQLAQTVTGFSVPVTATLESDQLTEVVVYKIGRLGTFSRHALDLRPGTYTVVGSRRGFRDVRRQLVIEPGVAPQPLAIRCEEKI